MDPNWAHPAVKLKQSRILPGQQGAVIAERIPAETLLVRFTGPVQTERTWATVEVTPDKHLIPGPIGTYINHSCEPSVRVETQLLENEMLATLEVYTLREMKPGEELTFDYATTESTLTPEAAALDCQCGAANCRGSIGG